MKKLLERHHQQHHSYNNHTRSSGSSDSENDAAATSSFRLAMAAVPATAFSNINSLVVNNQQQENKPIAAVDNETSSDDDCNTNDHRRRLIGKFSFSHKVKHLLLFFFCIYSLSKWRPLVCVFGNILYFFQLLIKKTTLHCIQIDPTIDSLLLWKRLFTFPIHQHVSFSVGEREKKKGLVTAHTQ